MLQPYRRHLKACPYRAKGQSFTLCQCPIWADGMLNGKRFRQSLHTTDGTRAEQIMQMIEAGRDPIYLQPKPAEARTVSAAITAFLAACSGRNVQPSTLDVYSRALKYLDGAIPLDTVDADFLDAHRAKRPINARSWRKELQILRIFFAWCLDRKWIADNPAKRLKMPHVDDLPTLPFTPEEVRAILGACDKIASAIKSDTAWIRKRARAIVLTLLYSGLRISDVAQLRRAALEPSGHLVLKVMKTGVRLKVLLHQDAIAALNALPSANPTYFFWTGRGTLRVCIKNLQYTVRRLGKIAGIHAHPHRFRDTFAVELLTKGADIRTVQKLLGHTSVRTTEKHYAHFVAAHQALLDDAASRLEFQPKPGRPLLMKPLHNRRRNAK
jgi:site-specific recombinase XerD